MTLGPLCVNLTNVILAYLHPIDVFLFTTINKGWLRSSVRDKMCKDIDKLENEIQRFDNELHRYWFVRPNIRAQAPQSRGLIKGDRFDPLLWRWALRHNERFLNRTVGWIEDFKHFEYFTFTGQRSETNEASDRIPRLRPIRTNLDELRFKEDVCERNGEGILRCTNLIECPRTWSGVVEYHISQYASGKFHASVYGYTRWGWHTGGWVAEPRLFVDDFTFDVPAEQPERFPPFCQKTLLDALKAFPRNSVLNLLVDETDRLCWAWTI